MLKVFLTLLGAIVLFAGLVAFAVLYPPSIFEEDLEFLETKRQPLTAKEVAKHLGHTEIGPGFYEYRIIGGDKRAEFWIGPPRPPSQVAAFGFPVEIAVVVVRTGVSDVRIIWPEEMKGRDFDEVIEALIRSANGDPDPGLRANAVLYLAGSRGPAQQLVPLGLKFLQSDDGYQRWAGASLLRDYRTNPEARAALEAALSDPDERVRSASQRALTDDAR